MANRPACPRLLPLLAATCLLLAGCFQSDEPKFPLASAAAALGEGGRYALYERDPDGRYQRQEVVVIKRRGDGAYDFIDEKGEAQMVSFHALGGGLFRRASAGGQGSAGLWLCGIARKRWRSAGLRAAMR
ncbi:MAG: hypothetical protein WBW74_13840 [Xanthobacteraceae bacterium]